MNCDLITQEPKTVLVVGDDCGMLAMLLQILSGRGYRVLLASSAASVSMLLDIELGIGSVLIRVGLPEAERIELMCLNRDVGVLFYYGTVEAGMVRLRLPERHLAHVPRILVVEDEPAVRDLFQRYLAEDGYHAAAAETCRRALAAAGETTFDAMVVDMSLPDADGVEAIRRLRADFPWAKILAVSGYMGGCMARLAGSAGATAVLRKPATSWELRKAVYGLLDPAGRWHSVTLRAKGFRAVAAGKRGLPMWVLEAQRRRPDCGGFADVTGGINDSVA